MAVPLFLYEVLFVLHTIKNPVTFISKPNAVRINNTFNFRLCFLGTSGDILFRLLLDFLLNTEGFLRACTPSDTGDTFSYRARITAQEISKKESKQHILFTSFIVK